MASASLEVAREKRATPYLVAHVAQSRSRVAVVVTSATDQEMRGASAQMRAER